MTFRRKIISSLIYPALLSIVAIGAVAFFMVKIIPTFETVFKGINLQLPYTTQVLINVSNFLRKTYFLLFISLLVFVYVFKQALQHPLFKKRFDILRFKLPILGKFFQIVATERFASEMSILVESGVPLIYALDITQRSTGNKAVEEIIAKVKNNVREGKSLGKMLEEFSFFSPLMIQMVMIGEETGKLSSMLKKVASFYQELVETFIVRFVNLFEPMLILFMGGVIGFIVISLFMPIFSLGTALK